MVSTRSGPNVTLVNDFPFTNSLSTDLVQYVTCATDNFVQTPNKNCVRLIVSKSKMFSCTGGKWFSSSGSLDEETDCATVSFCRNRKGNSKIHFSLVQISNLLKYCDHFLLKPQTPGEVPLCMFSGCSLLRYLSLDFCSVILFGAGIFLSVHAAWKKLFGWHNNL